MTPEEAHAIAMRHQAIIDDDWYESKLLAKLMAEYTPQEWKLVAELNKMKVEKDGITE